jgi:hypothetical protein
LLSSDRGESLPLQIASISTRRRTWCHHPDYRVFFAPAMPPRYQALRRLNPYRGMVQIVDLGLRAAQSYDGVTWHLRAVDGQGQIRASGIWVADVGLKAGQGAALGELVEALEARPPLPFPALDSQELWLLDRETGLPLALLASARAELKHGERPDPEWRPFAPNFTGFVSPSLARRDAREPLAAQRHRDVLARQVNHAARPHAAAQWFQRDPAGAGGGLAGLRLEAPWRGRALPAAAFPELLARETWSSRLEKSVIDDYHAYLAPILLLWPHLTDGTRARLEILACENPRWLDRVHRLLPRVLDSERIQAALVAAKLEQAAQISASGPESDWN